MMRERFSISLSKREAKLVWGLLDGAMDAGACADGLTEEEKSATERVANALLKFSRPETVVAPWLE
jgi:hypothetical protein